jgi:hypothetical protein
MKYRKIEPEDRLLIEDWISQDSDHAGRCTADFWLPQETNVDKPFVQSFVVTDDLDHPLMFVRAENLLRLHIQFGPNKRVNAKALMDFIPTIERDAKKRRYKQIIWESISKPLIMFARQFGYRESPSEIVKDLEYDLRPQD